MQKYNKQGLTTEEVIKLSQKYGKNTITRKKQQTKIEILIEVIMDPIILIMIVAMAIAFFNARNNGEYGEVIVISILILVNILISFIQEIKTLQKLESLNKLNQDYVHVIRDNKEQEIESVELVPGDLVKLKTGFIARADIELIEVNNLFVDESFLTGESLDVEKNTSDSIYSNSAIKNGTGYGVVQAIGMETKIGKIAKKVDEVEAIKSQLELKVLHITKILLIIAAITASTIALLTIINGYSIEDTLSMTISILIATVPEGLATVLAIVLTFMSQKMANNKALVKKVALLETLGEVEYVCSDKTGTITENKMTVTNVTNILENEVTVAISKAIMDTETPTSKAICKFLEKYDSQEKIEILDTIPFNSTDKKAAYLVQNNGDQKYIVIVGAPDFLITDIEKKVPEISNYTAKGLRTLAIMFAKTDLENLKDYQVAIAQDLDLISVFGIQDSPKKSAIEAIKIMHNAKIKTVMITGDGLATAKSIAKQAGIIESSADLAVSGEQLKAMSDEEFDQIVENVKVYARVNPEDKYRIVSRLQSKNKIIAMTGDGTNDSIALRKANVGIAMGIQGTDISKESADLILLDDNFATINEAIAGGRLIFDNLRKFIRQMLTSNAAHTGSILFALIFGLFLQAPVVLPMTAILILWVNIVSDAIPCLALGLDDPEKDLMNREPIDPDLKLLNGSTLAEILIRGLGIGFLVFVAFSLSLKAGNSEEYSRTIGFVVLSFGQLIHIFDARSFKTIYRKNIFENKLICIAVLASGALNLLIVYSPLQKVFGLESISFPDLIGSILIGSIMTFVFSFIKVIYQIIQEKRSR